MASGWARGFHARGKLAAFYAPRENNRIIKWSGYCEDIFANNPNIARPGQERQNNLKWFPHYKKQFPYCTYDGVHRRYIWTPDFKIQPGEFFFSADEMVCSIKKPFIVIEPNLAWHRLVNLNKDWGEGKFEALGKALIERGHNVVQCVHGTSRRKIPGAQYVPTPLFRKSAAIMAHADLIVAPEGANHHAAAALGVPSVIVWGDWSPHSMGYQNQIKLSGSKKLQACGHAFNCPHCREVMNSISVDEVYQAAIKELQ
jgi:ADP-heptose:LPS heptosyltransferase